jgi:hypothetical protein
LYERSYKTIGNRRHVEGFVRKIVQNGREAAPGRRFCMKHRTTRSRSAVVDTADRTGCGDKSPSHQRLAPGCILTSAGC